MTLEEIKLRRLQGQHLLTPADVQTVVKDLCGIQSQFMTNAMHSLRIRCPDFNVTDPTVGLVKNWTIRGTVHVFSQEDLPLFLRSPHHRCNDWSIPTWWNQRSDWALTPERQQFLSAIILSALKNGAKARDELKEICRAQGMTEAEENSMFHPWGGGIRELCERGFMNYVVQEQKAYCLTPEFTPLPDDEAELELARRYFTHFGPASIKEAAYFFGTTQTQVKKWLQQLPVNAAEYGGKAYYYIDSGLPTGEIPKCLFLAGFDQLMLGYEKKESLFLPQEHLRSIFNLAGIVHPAILMDGNVVGRWKQKERNLTITLFSPADHTTIEAAASELWPDVRKIEFI